MIEIPISKIPIEIIEGAMFALFLFGMVVVVDWFWSGKNLYGDYVKYRKLPFPILIFVIITVGLVGTSAYFFTVKIVPWMINNVRFT